MASQPGLSPKLHNDKLSPLTGAAAYVIAALLVAVVSWIRHSLAPVFDVRNTFMLFYPAVFLAAFLGGRGPGILAVGLSTIIGCYYFLPPQFSFQITNVADRIALISYVVTAGVIAILTAAVQSSGRIAIRRARELENQRDTLESEIQARRKTEEENIRLADAVKDAANRHQNLLADVLTSVTGGKLRLCEEESELPQLGKEVGPAIMLRKESLRDLRRTIERAAIDAGYPDERWQDLITAAGEAAMNAVNHAGGGMGRVLRDGNDNLQVVIQDRGKGIEMNNLHRATLEQGFTTTDSFGHGFFLMLKSVDRFWLLTGKYGTTVVLEQGRQTPLPTWLRTYEPMAAVPSDSILGQYEKL